MHLVTWDCQNSYRDHAFLAPGRGSPTDKAVPYGPGSLGRDLGSRKLGSGIWECLLQSALGQRMHDLWILGTMQSISKGQHPELKYTRDHLGASVVSSVVSRGISSRRGSAPSFSAQRRSNFSSQRFEKAVPKKHSNSVHYASTSQLQFQCANAILRRDSASSFSAQRSIWNSARRQRLL